LNKSIEEGIETEVSKLNFMITSLREENRHDIKNVNSKVNNLSEFVGEMIHEYVAETKKVHNDINNELKKHKLETESVLTNIRPELSNVRQRVFEETFSIASRFSR
jgi:vacuolar-type H+-ATPase subunit I/STV1